MEKNNRLLIPIFIFVLLIHIFPFLLLFSTDIQFGMSGSDESLGSSFSSGGRPMDVYYETFGNKKFKIIVTKLTDPKTDFINKIKDEEKEKKIEKEIVKPKKEIVKPVVKKKVEIKKKTKTKDDMKLSIGTGSGGDGKAKHGSDQITAGSGEGEGIGSGGSSAASEKGGHLNNPKPPYPIISQENGEEGDVGLEVVVETNGKPSSVRIYKSSGFKRLDNSALVTVRDKYTFLPAKRLGVPIRSTYRFKIKFKL